jgi:hypothetical protein
MIASWKNSSGCFVSQVFQVLQTVTITEIVFGDVQDMIGFVVWQMSLQ